MSNPNFKSLKTTLRKKENLQPKSTPAEQDTCQEVQAIELGAPPIDQDRVFLQMIQSNTNFTRTLKELVENSIDADADRIHVHIEGHKTAKGKFSIEGVTVKDTGIGMSHGRVLVKFRGLCQENERHDEGTYSGKNGVGVKTLFNFFRNMDVTTTTSGLISEWEYWIPEDIKDTVVKSFEQSTDLRPGSADTVLRSYHLERDRAVMKSPWKEADSAEQGTTIKLSTVHSGKRILVEEQEIIDMLSTHIDFINRCNRNNIDKNLTRDSKNGIFLTMGDHKKLMIKTIDADWSSSDFSVSNGYGSYLKATGSSDNGIHFSFINKEGDITNNAVDRSDFIPAFEDPDKEFQDGKETLLEDVHFNMQLTYGLQPKDKKILCQVSGSNVNIPESMWNSISQGHGFKSALRGVITTNNPLLKRALRHNRTDMEEGDPTVRAFWSYVRTVFAKMTKYYEHFQGDMNVESDDKSLEDLKGNLKNLFTLTRLPNANSGSSASEPKNSYWECNNCGHTWSSPKEQGKPSKCPSCGSYSEDISRKKNGGRDSFNVVWVNSIPDVGPFVAAHYEKSTNTLRLNNLHPDFMRLNTVPKKYWNGVKLERMTARAITAYSAAQQDSGNELLANAAEWEKKLVLKDLSKKKDVAKVLQGEKGLTSKDIDSLINAI
jgi:hypothetical protein